LLVIILSSVFRINIASVGTFMSVFCVNRSYKLYKLVTMAQYIYIYIYVSDVSVVIANRSA